jgi:hypothetical protein
MLAERRIDPSPQDRMPDDPMTNLTNPTLIKMKGILFLLLGLFAASLIVLEHPEWRVGLLLGVAIWSFCRFYYFAFYVIENYVDLTFRFAGLWTFFRYLITQHHDDRKPLR